MPDQDMGDALCACCAQPTSATTFPAVCPKCRDEAGWHMQGCFNCKDMHSGICTRCGMIHLPIPKRFQAKGIPQSTHWLATLTVGDAAFLHEMKIDPLG